MSDNPRDVTIYDIAKSLNISAATVSRGLKDHPAISKNTKKRIFEAAQAMGYRFNTFASNLRRQRTNTLGIIVPRLNSTFMSDVLAGMEKVANEAGYNLIISQSLEMVEKEIKNAKTMFNSRVDGLLVSLAYNTVNIEHFEMFIKKGIPIIFFDRVYEHPACPTIVINNYKAGYEVTRHLIEQGCRDIVHITGNQTRNVYQQRLKGYLDALADHGLIFKEQNLLINNLGSEEGTEAAKYLLSLPVMPDGVFVANDACAAACMIALKKQGVRIPEDIAFAGFNNDPVSEVIEPNLTTVNYKGYEMGEVAAKTLISHLNNNFDFSITNTLVLRHELIIRDSSLKKEPVL